ncbi:hypothetical protein EGW08_018399 [Elysia chlorotica]|uniref:Protein rolling stone n=1 Tax=Elysia chlorotica TaxID=188477 RepID=A0A3S1B320_ELYCH|nr:hypothetical protein EGW08_018399 [Elysia chlorotica]
MARQHCQEELRLRNFFYYFEDQTAFHRCQWKWPRCVYISLRVMLAAYTVFGFTYEVNDYYRNAKIRQSWSNTSHVQDDSGDEDFDDWDSRKPWFVYFTLWTYMVLTAHMLLAALLSILFKGSNDGNVLVISKEVSPRDEDSIMVDPSASDSEPLIASGGFPHNPRRNNSSRSSMQSSSTRGRGLAWYFKLSWCLSNIISTCAPIVTTIFFAALYAGGPVSLANINVHLLNTVFVVLDHLVSARPVRLHHWSAPALFGMCYTLFSYVFWTFDHVNHVVYKGVMDWNDPVSATVNTLVMVYVVNPIVHCFYFVLYRLKIWLYHKIYAPQSLL